jgi:hypothetical protein
MAVPKNRGKEHGVNGANRWSRILVIAGLVAMVVGAIDPLEGSLVILPGVGLVALGAWLGRSRHGRFLVWAFVLAAAGVGLLFGLSALGGFGGHTGRSRWWALVLLPYPVGWVMAIIGTVRVLRERRGTSAPLVGDQLGR